MKIDLKNKKRIPKNNSFDEKSNSPIKEALQSSLSPCDDEEQDQQNNEPRERRARLMTDCIEGSIEAINSNTHDLIKSIISQH